MRLLISELPARRALRFLEFLPRNPRRGHSLRCAIADMPRLTGYAGTADHKERDAVR